MRGAIAAGHPLTAEAGARVLREGGNAVDACVAAAPRLVGVREPADRAGRRRLHARPRRAPAGARGCSTSSSPCRASGPRRGSCSSSRSTSTATRSSSSAPARPRSGCPGRRSGSGRRTAASAAAPWAELVAPGGATRARRRRADGGAGLPAPDPRPAPAPLAGGGRDVRAGPRARRLASGSRCRELAGDARSAGGGGGGRAPAAASSRSGSSRMCRPAAAAPLADLEATGRPAARRSRLATAATSCGRTRLPRAAGVLSRSACRARRRAADAGRGRAGDGGAGGGAQPGLGARSIAAARQAVLSGTTHISVVDARGDAASLSASLGSGSGVVVPGTGIHLNNMLGEADLAGHARRRGPADVDDGAVARPSRRPAAARRRLCRQRAAPRRDPPGRRPRRRRRARTWERPSTRRASTWRRASRTARIPPWPTSWRPRGTRSSAGAGATSSSAASRAVELRADGSLAAAGDPRRGGAGVVVA